MTSLVVRDVGSAELEHLGLRDPGPTDVVVSMEASGLCHSDRSLYDGTLAGRFPVVLGHEGVGIVEFVGSDVHRTRPGDRVVLSAMPSCGSCWHCLRHEPYLCDRSADIRRPPFVDTRGPVRGSSGLGTFTDRLVLDELAVVPVETDLPAELLSVLGCAILTGVGSVLDVAAARPGDAIAVIGAGGVGLAAVQGARLAEAAVIVAVDPDAAARAAALAVGATHAVAPDDAVDTVGSLTGGRGVSHVIECVASSASFATSWRLARRGGRIVVVGAPRPDQVMPVPLVDIVLSGREILGSVYGRAHAPEAIPRYVALAEAGRLDLDALIGRRVQLADMPTVLDDTEPGAGRVVACISP